MSKAITVISGHLIDVAKSYQEMLRVDLDDTSSIRPFYQYLSSVLSLLVSVAALLNSDIVGISLLNTTRMSFAAFFIIVGWAILIRIIYPGENWDKFLSLMLNYITFWIFVTTFFVLFATLNFYFANVAGQIMFVSCVLAILIPVQVVRSKLSVRKKMIFPVLLWSSCMFFTCVGLSTP